MFNCSSDVGRRGGDFRTWTCSGRENCSEWTLYGRCGMGRAGRIALLLPALAVCVCVSEYWRVWGLGVWQGRLGVWCA